MLGGRRLPVAAASAVLLVFTAGCGTGVPQRLDATRVRTATFASEAPLPAAPQSIVQPASRVQEAVLRPRSALLVGVDRARGAPTLYGAGEDARTIERALRAYGFPPDAVEVQTGAAASREAILDGIARLAATAAPGGRAVFAFAGHTRRLRGQNHIVAADGRTIAASELAAALGRVRSPMWVALPTCYAAGFDVDGIVGPDRVVTFASDRHEVSYETSALGRSVLVHYLVDQAMLGGAASTSVEEAFAFARNQIATLDFGPLPILNDGFPGSFELGPRIGARGEDRPAVPGVAADAPPEAAPDPEEPDDPPVASLCGTGVALGRCRP